MTQYDYTKTANHDKLCREIEASASNFPCSHVDLFGDALSIFMTRDLTDDEMAALDTLVANHTTTDSATYIKNKILEAMDFGRNMMAAYGAQNVLAGRSVADIQTIMSSTSKVQAALLTGSLYVALTEIANITPDGTLITQGTLDSFRHQIQDYLGIPRT